MVLYFDCISDSLLLAAWGMASALKRRDRNQKESVNNLRKQGWVGGWVWEGHGGKEKRGGIRYQNTLLPKLMSSMPLLQPGSKPRG